MSEALLDLGIAVASLLLMLVSAIIVGVIADGMSPSCEADEHEDV